MISTALQRIGRSGHLLAATSKGWIVVLCPADLDDAVTIACSVHHAEIEETTIPENGSASDGPFDDPSISKRVQRYLQTRGPVIQKKIETEPASGPDDGF